MKYWIHLIVVIAAGFILGQWLPWWFVSVVAVVSSICFRMKFWLAGMFGFLAGFILWGAVAFYLDSENQYILSNKMGVLLGDVSGITLILVTGLIGGLLASLGSFVGTSLRPELSKK